MLRRHARPDRCCSKHSSENTSQGRSLLWPQSSSLSLLSPFTCTSSIAKTDFLCDAAQKRGIMISNQVSNCGDYGVQIAACQRTSGMARCAFVATQRRAVCGTATASCATSVCCRVSNSICCLLVHFFAFLGQLGEICGLKRETWLGKCAHCDRGARICRRTIALTLGITHASITVVSELL